ncbi:MAG: hypothetical protein LBR93_09225, partial [Treponema sp.]|nr:hypothetical protein [Treponema sp.]
MKKPFFAFLLAALAAVSLAAQEAPDTGALTAKTTAKIRSFCQDYVLRNFPKTAIEDNKIRNVAKYDEEVFGYTATDEEYSMLGSIGGVENLIDRATELAASAAILNIRPVEPQDALKIYTEIAMESTANSFLGITGATHAEVLSRLKA